MAGLVRGRVLGGTLALAGVLALVPSVFWPTSSYTQPGITLGDGVTRDLVNLEWSWGKYAFLGAPEEMLSSEMSSPWGLAYLVLMLLIGLSGAVGWLVLHGGAGRLIGVAGTAVVASYAAHVLADRAIEQAMFYRPDDVVIRGTPVAGRFEQAALVLLILAVVAMLWHPLSSLAGSAWAVASRRAAAARLAEAAVLQPTDGEGRGGVILHGERRGDSPFSRRPGDRTPPESVGFTDPGPDERDAPTRPGGSSSG